MSYSYIKSVFPNFKEPGYEQPKSVPVTHKPQPPDTPVSAYNDEELTLFVKNLLQKSVNIKSDTPETSANRRFTQPPIPSDYLNANKIEMFGNNTDIPISTRCEDYISHLLHCEDCKLLTMKELKLKRYDKQQEFIETIMYILFAILILLLLNNLKKQ